MSFREIIIFFFPSIYSHFFHPSIYRFFGWVSTAIAEASIKDEVLDRDRHRDETGTWSTDTMQFQVVAPRG